MLATCNDSVALLKMGKLAPKEEIPTTHNAPLSGALYNQLFHQVGGKILALSFTVYTTLA